MTIQHYVDAEAYTQGYPCEPVITCRYCGATANLDVIFLDGGDHQEMAYACRQTDICIKNQIERHERIMAGGNE